MVLGNQVLFQPEHTMSIVPGEAAQGDVRFTQSSLNTDFSSKAAEVKPAAVVGAKGPAPAVPAAAGGVKGAKVEVKSVAVAVKPAAVAAKAPTPAVVAAAVNEAKTSKIVDVKDVKDVNEEEQTKEAKQIKHAQVKDVKDVKAKQVQVADVKIVKHVKDRTQDPAAGRELINAKDAKHQKQAIVVSEKEIETEAVVMDQVHAPPPTICQRLVLTLCRRSTRSRGLSMRSLCACAVGTLWRGTNNKDEDVSHRLTHTADAQPNHRFA
jgi:hypothetical protein